tara:strand:+ start:195 stop:422 length:228 start_codon:yes stop_codon:yes gene_type:complete
MLIVTQNWKRGDLVKITFTDGATSADECTVGVVMSAEKIPPMSQQNMFPLISVFNFKYRRVDRVYPYNLEMLSSS